MPKYYDAIYGVQNGQPFYTANIEYGEVAADVQLPEEVIGKELFDDELSMQRKIMWARVKGEMKDYLLKNPQAFYSALTLFMIPRDFHPLKERETEDSEGDYFFRTINRKTGELIMYSSMILFPGDGQNRTASIREALKVDPSKATQQIPVVLLPFMDRAQVRQKFSDLNLHAKVANRTLGINFETVDPLMLITKNVANEVDLFRNRVNRQSTSLPESSVHVIALNTLHECTKVLVPAILGDDTKATLESLRGKKETSAGIVQVALNVAEVWNTIISELDDWLSVMDGSITPGEVRNKVVYAHGVGCQAMAQAAAQIIKLYPTNWQSELSDRIGNLDWRRSEYEYEDEEGNPVQVPNELWAGSAMAGNRVNNTKPGITKTRDIIVNGANQTDGAEAKPVTYDAEPVI